MDFPSFDISLVFVTRISLREMRRIYDRVATRSRLLLSGQSVSYCDTKCPSRGKGISARSIFRTYISIVFVTTMVKRGAFIVLEGLDRSGKSTQVARLVAGLQKSGHKAVSCRFPGESPRHDTT